MYDLRGDDGSSAPRLITHYWGYAYLNAAYLRKQILINICAGVTYTPLLTYVIYVIGMHDLHTKSLIHTKLLCPALMLQSGLKPLIRNSMSYNDSKSGI